MPPRDYDFKLWARAALSRWARDPELPPVRVSAQPCTGCVYCGRPLPPHRRALEPRTCSLHSDLTSLDPLYSA